MMDYIDIIINKLYSLPEVVIYIFLTLSAFTENICPPIPGDTIVAFGALLVGRNKLNFFIAYIFTTMGSLAGFMFVFWIGRYLGRKLFEKDYLFFKRENIIKAKEWLKSYGYILILFNRYIPGIRAVISIASGILRLSTLKVMIMAFIGCATWNFIIMYIGLTIGSNWNEIKERLSYLLSRYNIIVTSVLLGLILLFVITKWARKKS